MGKQQKSLGEFKEALYNLNPLLPEHFGYCEPFRDFIMFQQILRTLLLLLVGVPAVAQTALPTAWNFSTPPVTSPPNGWTYGIGLNGTGGLTYAGAQNSVGGDNTAARMDATGEFIKIWFADKPGALSYYIKGTGISPAPSFTGTFTIEQSPDDVTYTPLRVFTTANPIPGGNMSGNRYVDNPAPSTRYIRFFYTEKQSGSNVAIDSVWVRSAPPSANATINVKVGANTIVNNSQYVVGNTASTVFRLENTGTTQPLSIDSIRFSGDAASDYSVSNAPSSVAGGAFQNMNLNFTASTPGSRKATMRIYNSDPEKNPYVIQLYGIGGSFATEPATAPGSLTASSVTSYSCKLALTGAAPTAEKYLLIRRKGQAVADAPVDGQSYKVGDMVGSGMVAYVGDSLFSSYVPKYIVANSSYHFAAYSFNGPAGFENYLTSASAITSVQTSGKQPGNYYDGLDPLQTSFVTDLRNKINPHDTIFYSAYAPRLVSTWLERDTVQGQKVVNCIYTNIPYIYNGSFAWWSGSGGNTATLTREHSFPQSWMPSNTGANWPTAPNGKEYPEYNDMHHLYPAHQQNANARRGNNPYGVVVNATYTSPTGMGKLGTNAGGQTVYEPRDEHKGDAARALMYMAACYNKATPAQLNWSFPTNQSPALILQWHQQDPPSDFEIARHELVAQYQKNRNPFIDHPEWASYINFATMGYVVANQPLEFHNGLATWPNPSQDKIFVDASLYFTPSMSYEWLDVTGKLLKQGQLEAAITQVELPADKGVYFLRIQTPNGARMTRVVKN